MKAAETTPITGTSSMPVEAEVGGERGLDPCRGAALPVDWTFDLCQATLRSQSQSSNSIVPSQESPITGMQLSQPQGSPARSCNSTKGINMEQVLINLVAGALGGLGAGKSSSTFDLGTAGNLISGLVGGGLLGQIATLLLPSVLAAAQSGDMSASGIISHVVAGGAGGAVLTAIIGAIKNRAAA